MNKTAVQKLEELLNETRRFLSFPDPDPEMWQEYGARREAIFAHLSDMVLQGTEEERAPAARLIEEILQLDAALKEKLKASLQSLQGDMALLTRGHRALKGYRLSRTSIFLEHHV